MNFRKRLAVAEVASAISPWIYLDYGRKIQVQKMQLQYLSFSAGISGSDPVLQWFFLQHFFHVITLWLEACNAISTLHVWGVCLSICVAQQWKKQK